MKIFLVNENLESKNLAQIYEMWMGEKCAILNF